MGRIEELMLMISRPEFVSRLSKVLILLFGAGLILYEIAIYVYYTKKYQSARKSVADYHVHLKRIHKFYEEQESAAESVSLDRRTDEENTL